VFPVVKCFLSAGCRRKRRSQTMPRTKPLPQREQLICRRVAKLRHDTNLKRVAFARELGTDSSTVSNIEHCRSPVRSGLGERICELLRVNQGWLADGQKPEIHCFPLSPIVKAQIDPQELFSRAFDREIKPLLEQRRAEILRVHGVSIERLLVERAFSPLLWTPLGDQLPSADEQGLMSLDLSRLSPDLAAVYLRTVLDATAQFWKEHPDALENILRATRSPRRKKS